MAKFSKLATEQLVIQYLTNVTLTFMTKNKLGKLQTFLKLLCWFDD